MRFLSDSFVLYCTSASLTRHVVGRGFCFECVVCSRSGRVVYPVSASLHALARTTSVLCTYHQINGVEQNDEFILYIYDIANTVVQLWDIIND